MQDTKFQETSKKFLPCLTTHTKQIKLLQKIQQLKVPLCRCDKNSSAWNLSARNSERVIAEHFEKAIPEHVSREDSSRPRSTSEIKISFPTFAS